MNLPLYPPVHPPSLNVIGCGKVGRVLARLFAQQKVFLLQDILNRSQASTAQAVQWLGNGTACPSVAQLRPANVWMLSLADDQILAALASLKAEQAHLLRAGDIVFHCSGALASSHMRALLPQDVLIASLHPVRSFADPSSVLNNFAGTFCSVEGDSGALAVLLPALQAISAQVLQISAEHKSLYHAASVFACNYLCSLLDVAQRTWQQAGIAPEQARQLAEPLVRETVDNVFRLGAAQALTGPIARGDMQTVARQQQALDDWGKDGKDIAALYRAFTATTLDLAARKRAE